MNMNLGWIPSNRFHSHVAPRSPNAMDCCCCISTVTDPFLLPFSYERSKKEVICLVAVFFHSPSNSERFEPLSFRLHKPFRLPVYKYLCTCFHANVLVADSKFISFSIRRLMISVLPSVQRVHANRIPPCVCMYIYSVCFGCH